MKTRPILFSAQMVRALLDGSKTQTRRVLKQAIGPSLSVDCDSRGLAELSWLYGDGPGHEVHEHIKRVHCLCGQPGDHLWVREPYFQFGHWEPVPGVKTKGGKQKWKFAPDSDEIRFDAPPEFRKGITKDRGAPVWHQRLARFMPRKHSRIRLEIVSVRVERLQDISPEDAIAEGIECNNFTGFGDEPPWQRIPEPDAYRGTPNHDWTESPVEAYKQLWGSINGPGSWDANPWVWVIELKLVMP